MSSGNSKARTSVTLASVPALVAVSLIPAVSTPIRGAALLFAFWLAGAYVGALLMGEA